MIEGRQTDGPKRGSGLRLSDPVLASALTVAAALSLLLPIITLGDVSSHMVAHILVMSVAAPLLTVLGSLLSPRRGASTRQLWAATTGQIVLLWAWHLPSAHHFAAATILGTMVMHASLLGAAILFWDALIRLQWSQQWHGILALLVTGKLACLLAGLLVFATRPLFYHAGAAPLDDQQLAGLLMIVACPASYVLAGIMTATRFVGILQAHPRHRTTGA